MASTNDPNPADPASPPDADGPVAKRSDAMRHADTANGESPIDAEDQTDEQADAGRGDPSKGPTTPA